MRRDEERLLIEARKSCDICMRRNPGKIHSGASFDFDPYVVSYWSQWLGHPRPQILVIGQDFSDVGYFKRNRGAEEDGNKTNEKLFELLKHIGLSPGKPPREDRDTRVFLTNSILCLKDGQMNSSVRLPWVRACAVNHLRPLVQKLDPRIVVAMGGPGWLAARVALYIEDAPQKIAVAAGCAWTTRTGIKVFAVGHCGPLGIANRPWCKQLEDWSRVGDALRQIAPD